MVANSRKKINETKNGVFKTKNTRGEISAALSPGRLARRWLSRLVSLPLLFASSDLAAFFLLLIAARSTHIRFVGVGGFLVAFSPAFSASAS
jgi:hypothetical protein